MNIRDPCWLIRLIDRWFRLDSIDLNIKLSKVKKVLEFDADTENDVLFTFNPTTHGGKPVAIDGDIVGSVDTESGASVVQVDQLNFKVITPLVPGDVLVNIRADARLGPDVKLLEQQVLLHVRQPEAEALGLTLTQVVKVPTA